MGILDFLHKKSGVGIKFQEQTPSYNPWENSNKTRNDDYAIAAFISMSEKGSGIGRTNDDYARYFSYEYGVNDPIKYHKKVIADGYLEEAGADVALNKMKVSDLKEILDRHGIGSKGKKEELVSLIIENVDTATLSLEKYYVPSSKGKEHLKKYEYIFEVKRYGISLERYEAYKNNKPDWFKSRDIMWRILDDTFNEHNIVNDFGLARNVQYNMAVFLEDEKRYLDALFHYVVVLYYDMSGCGNNNIRTGANALYIAPKLSEAICRLGKYYQDEIISRCYANYRLPRHYLSHTNFKKLVCDIIDDETIIIEKYI